ncbi:MAG TPA: MerR family transcriptional regulator [Thermodesulfovibrionales bacterium]|nr:MerR family transcriptional regulator [Thermodesulfovibrionales bacterium]
MFTKQPLQGLTEQEKKTMALYPIMIASEFLGTTEQTLRVYEHHGLISPSRRGRQRFYSENDITWLQCLRNLIHIKKISIAGIKKLLEYAACWDIMGCSEEVRKNCSAFRSQGKAATKPEDDDGLYQSAAALLETDGQRRT